MNYFLIYESQFVHIISESDRKNKERVETNKNNNVFYLTREDYDDKKIRRMKISSSKLKFMMDERIPLTATQMRSIYLLVKGD